MAARAHYLVKVALQDGRLVRPDKCDICGDKRRVVAHHDDYAKPLEIRWLCFYCHKAWHNANGPGRNRHLSGMRNTGNRRDFRYKAMQKLMRSGLTLQAVGDKYSVTREFVRQIVGSVKKLRPLQVDLAEANRKKIEAMRLQGKTLEQISEDLGISQFAIWRIGVHKRVREPKHGTANEYRRGCRCDLCREANAEKSRKQRRKKS